MAKSTAIKLFLLAALILAAAGGACASNTAKPFAAENYTNDDFGFYVLYPQNWKPTETDAPYCIFRAVSDRQLPAMSISVLDPDKGEQQAQEIYDYWKLTNITPMETKLYILADGQTKSQYSVTRMTHPEVLLINYSVTFERKGKLINVGIATMSGAEDPVFFNEIFQTITFYK